MKATTKGSTELKSRKGETRQAVYNTLEKFGRDVPTTTLMEEVARIIGKTPSLHTLYTCLGTC